MRHLSSKRLPFALAASLVLAACQDPIAPAPAGHAAASASRSAYQTTGVVRTPVDEVIYSCSPDVEGWEPVRITGTIQMTRTVTATESGRFLIRTVYNYQNVGGVGEVTGRRYRVTMAQSYVYTGEYDPATGGLTEYAISFVTPFNVVGQGSGVAYGGNVTGRAVFDLDGNFTSVHYQFTSRGSCIEPV